MLSKKINENPDNADYYDKHDLYFKRAFKIPNSKSKIPNSKIKRLGI